MRGNFHFYSSASQLPFRGVMLCRSGVALSISRTTHLKHLFQKLTNFSYTFGNWVPRVNKKKKIIIVIIIIIIIHKFVRANVQSRLKTLKTDIKRTSTINKLIYLKLNLRPGGFAGDLRCGKIESFQISFERCEWRGKSNWEWNGVPNARCADTESALSNGCVGCLRRDLSDERSRRVGA